MCVDGGTQTFCHCCCAIGLSGLSGESLPNQQVRCLGPQQCHAPSIHKVPTWAIRCIARYGVCPKQLVAKLVAVSSVARSPDLVCPAPPLYTPATLQWHTLQCLYVLKLITLTK